LDFGIVIYIWCNLFLIKTLAPNCMYTWISTFFEFHIWFTSY
jgi:hypothetical protein